MIAISRTGRVLRRLVRLSCRRPAVTVAISLLLAALSIAYTTHALTFKTSTRALLPQDAGYVIRYAEYAKEFGELEDIVVVVEAGSFEGARAYAARLTEELKGSEVKFHRVAYRIDPKRFEGRQLLYLSTAELREIRDKIFDHQEFMESFAGDPSLARLLEGVNTQMAAAFVSNLFDIGLQDRDLPVDTRFLRVLLDQMASRLERPAPYRSPWGTLFSFGEDPPDDAGYFLSDDKSLLFILVETPPSQKGSFMGDQAAIETIRGAVARLKPAFPNVQAGVTGAPALSNDEMTAAFHDSGIADVLAFALTLLVMTLAFVRVGKPLLMLGVLAVTMAWSMGVVTLTVGHLTLFSVMFISIVVGIGIDYGIYYLFRYEEEIFLGRNLREALELTAARTGPGMLIGALTAAGTFFVLMLTDFRGIQELGFIAGIAILLAWVGMITLFPAALMLVDRHHADRPRGHRPRAHQLERLRVPFLDRLVTYPRTILIGAGLLTAFSLWAVPRVGFDYNVLNLQAKGTESVAWERRILSTTGRSGFTGLSSASSLEELRAKQAAFEKLPSVSETESVLRVIPDDQAEKIAVIKSFAPLVAPIRVGRSSPVELDRLKTALADIKRRFDVVAVEAGAKLPAEVRVVREKTIAVQRLLARSNRDSAEAALNYLQAQLYRDFVNKFYSLQRNLGPTAVTIKDVPEEIRRKFIGETGRFLIQIHPKVDTWEKAGAAQFVRDLRTVDPDVTGPPVITYEATTLMERAYLTGSAYAFVLVGGLSLLMIRRLRASLLGLVPMVLGVLWTIGLMHVCGVKFNLANIWGLPLIIGTAAEFGLNVILSHLEGRAHGGPLVARSAVLGVTLNGITTMVGFGSLMIASHQGIFSLGLLLTLGSACGLAAALLVLPVVLKLTAKPVAQLEPVEKPSAA
ncbi:MAG TPA: MMPL family transporter [Candidatus Deferrimicrobiaceae bacterium]|nr:MMPL family transporter [Candidatus Deferrimicrobiaceae bacterium]